MKPQETYCEYWRLTKPPFDNVPDPEMYFDMHSTVNNAVSEVLFAIEEGNECLAVVVGDVGLGKTMALRVILDSLEEDRYRIAFLTNPDMTFIQLMREIIGQLKGEHCLETRREAILESFNHLLFDTSKEGKKVLIFIDEANAINSSNLESLRLLTNMQRDDENLLTIVLAGQLELARRLEQKKHVNLFQRIGVYCRLTTIENRTLMQDYIDHRMERAGTTEPVFTAEAYDAIWEQSEQGVPRLVNKIAKLSLKAGQTQGLRQIDAHIVTQIGSRFGRMSTAMKKEHHERSQGRIAEGAEFAVTLPAEDPAVTRDFAHPSKVPPMVRSDAPVDPERQNQDQTPVPMAETTSPPDPEALAEMITFPPHIYTKALKLPADERLRFAGQLAAQVLKKHPQLIEKLGVSSDPVPAWNTLRNVLMGHIEHHPAEQNTSVA